MDQPKKMKLNEDIEEMIDKTSENHNKLTSTRTESKSSLEKSSDNSTADKTNENSAENTSQSSENSKSHQNSSIDPQKSSEISQPEDEEPHCQFWVKRKKRYCKMTLKPGRNYCGEHQPIDPSSTRSLTRENRIVCPLDPSHSVFSHNLKKHLNVCNARKSENQPSYLKKNFNIIECETEETEDFRLSELPQNEIESVKKIVCELFDAHVKGKIKTEIMSHKVLDDELKLAHYGDDKIRHLLQTSSILGILESKNLLKSQRCFIDLGAGKGHLSLWLSKVILSESLEDSKVLVVDRASHRYKRDNIMKEFGVVERLRADIADLDLTEVNFDKSKSVVGVSKHLCGRATDFALKCLLNGNKGNVKSEGFLICLCCHHQITFDTFIGRDWMIANGIDRKIFNVIIKMVSWGVCGDGRSRAERKEGGGNCDEKFKEREEIGWKCKRLLDYARVKYMCDNGYNANLSFYVDKSQTLENVCIVGTIKANEN